MVTCGQSLHWMAWDIVLPRFRDVLTASGLLVLLNQAFAPAPWEAELGPLIGRYSTNQDYAPYDLVDELEQRELFTKQGEARTQSVHFTQSVDDYIESCHARNGFSRERMDPQAAAAFDGALRERVLAHVPGGRLDTEYAAVLEWGRPTG